MSIAERNIQMNRHNKPNQYSVQIKVRNFLKDMFHEIDTDFGIIWIKRINTDHAGRVDSKSG